MPNRIPIRSNLRSDSSGTSGTSGWPGQSAACPGAGDVAVRGTKTLPRPPRGSIVRTLSKRSIRSQPEVAAYGFADSDLRRPRRKSPKGLGKRRRQDPKQFHKPHHPDLPKGEDVRRKPDLRNLPHRSSALVHRSFRTRLSTSNLPNPTEQNPGTLMAFRDILGKFKKGLARTARLFDVRSWFGRQVDQDFLDDLEARLIQADVGVKATRKVLDRVNEVYRGKTADEELVEFVKQELKALLHDPRPGTLQLRLAGTDGAADRRGQRLGQDDLDRQARPAPEGRRPVDPARCLRHLPRRGGGPARHLGRTGRRRHRPRQPERRPGQRRPRRVRQGAGEERRCPHH